MREQLTKLLKVKSLWSIIAMFVFVYLVVTEKISGEIAMSLVTSIVTYYFVKREEKNE